MGGTSDEIPKWVTAAELCDWIGGDVSQVEALVRDGVLKPNEAGLFELWASNNGHQILAGRHRHGRNAARRGLRHGGPRAHALGFPCLHALD
jgi:hypothetical protein